MSAGKYSFGQYPEALLSPLNNCTGHQGVDIPELGLVSFLLMIFFFLTNCQSFAVTKLEFTTSDDVGLFIWGRES